MKFKANTRRRAIEYEKDLVQKWKRDKTFEKSVDQRPADQRYVFYDGPPFITGVPHHGTLLVSMIKDAVPRYQTMKGKRVERVWGWDTHGLPAERYTEKKLGINSREEVLEYGIEKYILECRANMVQTGSEWEDTIDRIGRWVDFKGAYKTMDKDYMESVWWAFKTLYDKGKIFEGEKVLMYCTLDGTPLSKAEVTMDAGSYQDVTDPSVYVKFPLINKQQTTFILCGGTERKYDTFGKDLAKEITSIVSQPKILDVYFARPEKDWQSKFDEWEVFYKTYFDAYSREMATLDNFYEQVESADVVFFHGGQTSLLKQTLPDYEKVKQALAGKIYVGSSAGANYVAKHSYSPDGILENSGILPINTVVHYESDNPNETRSEEDAKKLEEMYSNEKTLRIPEGEFEIIRTAIKFLLAWTTTPWTLPANTALAVNKDVVYQEIERGGETFIVAKDLVQKVFTDEKHQPLEYKTIREFKGEELVGLSYKPLFVDRGENAHKIWHADYVETEAGTGIVHLAPTYGEEDFELAKKEKIPAVHVIDENGLYTEGDWIGQNVWEVNKPIAKALFEQGIVWKIDYYRHSYPHCHRCGTRLMYRAHPSWFMDIDGQRKKMLEKNSDINWFPPHVKNGRFAKTIEQAPDWNISRDRFWATAMPVWKSPSGKVKIVGSYAELKELSGVELEDYHRPWVDDITFELDGETYTRTDKVIDSWFEAGSMPFAQFHYPFENKDKFEANFPGDFIVEYIAQTRAWFYYMHAMSVALFGEKSFKNVIVTGTLAGSDGRKMSKSYGNYTDPNELMDKFSADSLRFLFLSSPLLSGEDFALQDKEVGDVARKLGMIWNMYDFFTMYAEVDGWEYDGVLRDPLTGSAVSSGTASRPISLEYASGDNGAADAPSDTAEPASNPLDIWIISRLHQLVQEVETHMDGYNLPDAISPILPFLDDASNWYVRRSRRRFWKSEDDGDKQMAYRTLHYVLVRLAYLLAPFTPFLADELYHNLTGDEESVHLKDWLPAGELNERVISQMTRTRELINAGLSLRMKKDDDQDSIKVRQPLQVASYAGEKLEEYYEQIMLEELNVKEIRHIENLSEYLAGYDVISGNVQEAAWLEISKKLTPELRREGLMREVVRHVQAARKAVGLNIDDRIALGLNTGEDELNIAITEHRTIIASETLSERIDESTYEHTVDVKVEGADLKISLQKA